VVPFGNTGTDIEGRRMKSLFASRGFVHDPQGALTAVQQFALVRIKLALQIVRSFLDACGSRSLELLAAIGADGHAGHGTDVFYDPNRAFSHAHSLAHGLGGLRSCRKSNGTTAF
jgi:hypothetical protein